MWIWAATTYEVPQHRAVSATSGQEFWVLVLCFDFEKANKLVIVLRPISMSIKWMPMMLHLVYVCMFLARWNKRRCVCVWKTIKFYEKKKFLKRSSQVSIKVHKITCIYMRKFTVEMVQDSIFLHKESWGHGNPTGSY